MMVNRRKQISDLLREHEDGLSVCELVKMTGALDSAVRAAIRVTESIYIDRWRARQLPPHNGGGQRVVWEPVYCLHPAPPDAPKPNHKPAEDDIP